MKPLIAVHEAGHAVVAAHLRFRVDGVWAGSDGGWCDFGTIPSPSAFATLRRALPHRAGPLLDRLGLAYAAGPAAEVVFSGEPPGHDGDIKKFREITGESLPRWYPRAVSLVAELWPQVERVADALTHAKGNKLTGDEVRSLLGRRVSVRQG